jgi:type I restriction enzyme, S subunit
MNWAKWPSGFRRRKVGEMLPKGWQRSTIGECSKFLSGNTPSKENHEYWSGDFPWVTVKDMKRPWIHNTGLGLTQSGKAASSVAPANAILVVTRGMALLKDLPVSMAMRDVAFNQDIKAIVPKEELDPLFFAYQLLGRKHDVLSLVDTAGHGTGRLDTDLLKSVEIVFPPLPEQRRIAKILATWDQAIAATERLLANSRRQKQVLIGSLISDRKAARGNQSSWEQSTLCQVATVAVSSVNKKSESGERAVQLCNYTDVYYRDCIDSRIAFMQATASDNEIEKFTLRQGDVIITKDSETAADIAVATRVTETVPNLVCGYHLAMIRPNLNRIDPVFLHSYFNLPRTKDYFASNANGVTRFGLPLGAIQDAPIAFPCIDEQRQIGKIISNAELEVAGLVKDIELLKRQKLALMAQLLTGKRRVNLPQEEASA